MGATVASVNARLHETREIVEKQLPRRAAEVDELREKCPAGSGASIVDETVTKLVAAESAGVALIAALLGLEHCILYGGFIRLGTQAALKLVGMVRARVSYVAFGK